MLLFLLVLLSVFKAFPVYSGNDTLKRTVREELPLSEKAVSIAISQWLQKHQCNIIFEEHNGCLVGFEYQDNPYLVVSDNTNEAFELAKIFYIEDEVYTFLNTKGYLQQYLESANKSIGIKANVVEVKGGDKYQINLLCDMFIFANVIDPYMDRALGLVNRWHRELYPYYNIYLETKNAEAKEKQE